MTPCIPENASGWLADWSLVTMMDEMLPPRHPNGNDDDDEKEEDEQDEEEDEEEEPAVIREPDE